VEGPQALREAVAAAALIELFVTPDAAGQWTDLLARARAAGARIFAVDTPTLASLTETENPQGLAGVCRWAPPALAAVLAGRPALSLLLHEVNDPGNAGAVIRVADATGAGFVALSDNCVDPTNGKCVRSSTGSVFHLPVVAAGATAEAITALQQAGIAVLAADIATHALDLFDLAESGGLLPPTAWLMGNEAHGLPVELLAAVDAVVRIPILGRAESLNLATAAAVCMYASVREQRRAGS
jgi:RNA methyltransferase, TrmH family